jgi:hypothetical protein
MTLRTSSAPRSPTAELSCARESGIKDPCETVIHAVSGKSKEMESHFPPQPSVTHDSVTASFGVTASIAIREAVEVQYTHD